MRPGSTRGNTLSRGGRESFSASACTTWKVVGRKGLPTPCALRPRARCYPKTGRIEPGLIFGPVQSCPLWGSNADGESRSSPSHGLAPERVEPVVSPGLTWYTQGGQQGCYCAAPRLDDQYRASDKALVIRSLRMNSLPPELGARIGKVAHQVNCPPDAILFVLRGLPQARGLDFEIFHIDAAGLC